MGKSPTTKSSNDFWAMPGAEVIVGLIDSGREMVESGCQHGRLTRDPRGIAAPFRFVMMEYDSCIGILVAALLIAIGL